jgi:hypothetical protein
MTVITTPTATAGFETISPARMQTMPTAKPIGQIVGPGECCPPFPSGDRVCQPPFAFPRAVREPRRHSSDGDHGTSTS